MWAENVKATCIYQNREECTIENMPHNLLHRWSGNAEDRSEECDGIPQCSFVTNSPFEPKCLEHLLVYSSFLNLG